MNKETLRKYFITRNIDFNNFDNIQEKLESISIFDSDNQLDMKSFYNEITKILSWELINSIPFLIETGQENEKTNLVLNLQAWAKNAWKTGIIEANISRIVTAYTIIERLYLCPNRDLDWCIKSEKLMELLKKLLPNITLDVQLDSLPDNISFRDRRFHSVYKEALINKNYKIIIEFLSNNGFLTSIQRYPSYNFLKIIFQLAITYPILIIENFPKYSLVLVNTIFSFLTNIQIISLLEIYDKNDPLPLLLGLLKIINPEGNNLYNEDIEKDNITLEKVSFIIKKIVLLIKTDNIYKFITDCSNISMNKLWHGIFMIFLSRNNKYTQSYINSIDFMYNKNNLGEYSYLVYGNNCENENDFDKFSIMIYEKYLQELKYLKHGHFFRFTSYYQFIIHAIKVLTKNTFSKYLILLEEKSLSLRKAIYSWNHDELIKHFTDWFYWLISAKFFKEREPIKKDMILNTYNLLNDKRIYYKLNCNVNGQNISFNNLVDFLDNPYIINSILLPDNDDIVEIIWNNTDS